MLVDPAGDAHVGGVERELAAAPRGQRAADVGDEHGDRRAEHLRHVARGDLQQRVDPLRAGQLAAHGVERGGPLLAVMGGLGLRARPHGEAADDEADDQHHREREQVADVANGEREVGRDEEEVEGGHAEHGGHQRGPPAGAHGHQHDAQQVDHDQVR